MRPAAICFDNDGVLVDTEHLHYEAWRAALAEIGVVVSEIDFIDLSLRQPLDTSLAS